MALSESGISVTLYAEQEEIAADGWALITDIFVRDSANGGCVAGQRAES